jgi:hypothetical protein
MNQNKKTSNEVLKKIAIKKLLYQRSNKRITKIKPLVLDLKKLKTDSLIYKKKILHLLKVQENHIKFHLLNVIVVACLMTKLKLLLLRLSQKKVAPTVIFCGFYCECLE